MERLPEAIGLVCLRDFVLVDEVSHARAIFGGSWPRNSLEPNYLVVRACVAGIETERALEIVVQIVWFKRDLRVFDHLVLAAAAARGEVLPVYIVEPEFWQQPDASERQWHFARDCLESLRAELARYGQPLVVRIGDVIDVLTDLNTQFSISTLWSHEETGNAWTFARDQRVEAWCRANGIPWEQRQNHGVVRRLASRDGWAAKWDRLMAAPAALPPHLKPQAIDPGGLPSPTDLGLVADDCTRRQTGGRDMALDRLQSFLHDRGETYRVAMSSPVSGENACSRLSADLAWGSLSMREVAQATWARQRELREQGTSRPGPWRGSMRSFSGRLHWHCHFIQKLEDQPSIEFQNLHRSYDALRPRDPDAVRLEAWAKGETGLPFVDACMRYLRATGWLNFRMRAMVMATASYHLWLDWRAPGLVLARLFTDYEPGIHWSQVQMQSGTTGINTVRIYNPVKQGTDQDPTGAFTRQWVPELDAIADEFLQEPWTAPNADDVLGRAYPCPIVDHLEAAKQARARIWAVRKRPEFRSVADGIQDKHGSRKSGVPNRGRRSTSTSKKQLQLPL